MKALLTIRDEDRYDTGRNGAISPMPNPALFGFSRDRFTDDSYLWRRGEEVLVSLITCKTPGRGHFKHLIQMIELNGFRVAVPCPLGHMEAILRHLGFHPTYEDADMGDGEQVDVWRKP